MRKLFQVKQFEASRAIGLFLLLATSSFSPAESALLEGYVESFHAPAHAPAPVNTVQAGKPVSSGGGGGMSESGGEILALARPPALRPAYTLPNSFPEQFVGRWRCITRVIDSNVHTVMVGTEMASDVRFMQLPSGRVVAEWVQPGWTETQSNAVGWNAGEARVDRTSYFFGDGVNGAWGCRSRDHFIMESDSRIACKSYVDQYVDGVYIGRYRTISTLTRESDSGSGQIAKRKSSQ